MPAPDRVPFPEDLADLRDQLDVAFRATPVHATLGIELVDWGLGWAECAVVPRPSLVNLAGTVHGGLTFVLADAAVEVAGSSWGRPAVPLQLSCHYHLPAALDGGPIRAGAVERARGRRTASYDVDVLAVDDELLISYQALAHRSGDWQIDAARIGDRWS